MKFRREAIVSSAVVAACMGATGLHAQAPTGVVSGRVVASSSPAASQAAAAASSKIASQGAPVSQGNASQSPLAGARVSVVGTSIQTIVREDGRYVLPRVPAGPQRIRVNLVGFAPQEQAVTVVAGQPATVNFGLQATAVALSNVVVIGYGTQRREDLTGSIASVNSQDIQKTAVNTLEQGLQGRVPGVQVTQGDAAPGGGIRVQIRGTNSMNPGSAQPLYVIDGVPVGSSGTKDAGSTSDPSLVSLTQTNPLAEIAPEDIESIDILKDASATAIYGSRGANGVVMITTKRGRRNSGGQYTLNVSQGVASTVREVPVLSAPQYATYVNQAFINAYGPATQYPYGGRPGSLTPDSIQKVMGSGTDWQSLIYRNAPLSDANIGASGGDDRGSYAVSGNLLQQQGVINGSEFKRGGLRFNLDRNVTERFRLSTNVTLTRSVNNMVRTSTINGYNAIGVVRDAITYTPIWRTDSTKTDPRAEDPTTLANFGSNPLRYTDEVSENDQVTRGLGGVRGTVTLGKGFSFDQNIGANYESRNYGVYYPSTVNEGRTSGGDAIQAPSLYNNILSESWLRYAGGLGANQRVDAIAGYTFQNDRSTWNQQEVQGFPNDILGGNVLQNGTVPLTPQSGISTSQLASWLARVNYQLLDRYLLTGTVRADGSSRFAANNKWATFPAVAFAWRASEEPFLRGQRLFSDLKVRLSYGKSGNQAINPYQSLPAIGGITGVTQNETTVPAYAITQLGNPNLKWETTNQFDGGLDLGAFNNRLTGTFDYYHKNTYDLLQQITLAQNTGFGNTWINSGNVTNRGIEFLVGYDVLRSARKGGLTWNTSINASHNVNRIVSLGNGIQQQFATRLGAGGNLEATPFIQKVGLPIGAMWGYTTAGIVQNAADSAAYAKVLGAAAHIGDLKYADINGDGKVDANDQHVIGDANPKWTWGWNNTFRIGKFDASALVIAVKGNSIINAERMRYITMNGSINIPTYYLQNAFDPKTNPNGTFPMILQSRQADTRFSDIYIEDGSFVRLKNVQLGYNVSLPRVHSARVYVNGINLLTHTRYTGYDPEVSAFGDPAHPGVDLGSYPQQRTFTFGVNTSF